jgi:hypothetical protein
MIPTFAEFTVIQTLGALLLLMPTMIQDDKPETQVVSALAKEMGDATIAGKYDKVIDRTYPGIIKMMGGREKAIEMTQAAMDKIKAQGVALKSFTAGTPGSFETEGSNTFVVIPTEMEMTFPMGKIKGKSYLLGISPDGGKTWTFADGNGIRNASMRDKILPKLPAKLKLPEVSEPQVIKE